MTYRVTATIAGIVSQAIAVGLRKQLDQLLRDGLPPGMMLTVIVGEEDVEDGPQHEHLKGNEDEQPTPE